MTRRNYETRFHNGGAAIRIVPFTICPTPPNKRRGCKNSVNAAVQSEITRKKNGPTPISVKKTCPDKSDIKRYCRKDLEFRKLDDFIREGNRTKNYKGVTPAEARREHKRAEILRILPFGSILG